MNYKIYVYPHGCSSVSKFAWNVLRKIKWLWVDWFCLNSHKYEKVTYLNTLRPRQNGHHFADDIFKCIFLNENVWIQIKISLKFVPKGPINNIPALVQIMARHRPGDKSLSEPMVASLLAHICVTRPQWVNVAWWCHVWCQNHNTLRPRQNGRRFAADIFKWILLNENVWTPIRILLKFVPMGPIENISTLVQVMADASVTSNHGPRTIFITRSISCP